MSLKITKQHDPINIEHIVTLIYGDPGVGKTSLAQTASAPLTLDFDQGIHRSGYRKDSVQVSGWSELADMEADDLAGYNTIVVDTVGRLLDSLSFDLINRNPKFKGYGGALTLQGYGALKSEFASWLKLLRQYGKDVILVAHNKEDKNGDDLIDRPDIQGGSYIEIFKMADAVAYMHQSTKQTLLEFSPSDRWVGKNPAGFDNVTVPNFSQKPDFMGELIETIKAKLNEISEESQAIVNEVEGWRESIQQAGDVNAVNELVGQCKAIEHPSVAAQAKRVLHEHTKSLGMQFDKQAGQYQAKGNTGAADKDAGQAEQEAAGTDGDNTFEAAGPDVGDGENMP